MSRRLLISGIDVGLHTSVALLNLDGEIIFLDTMKSPKISEVLKTITDHGTVVSVSTDKSKAPSKARKISSSLGSRVISPRKNMTNKKKRMMIEDHLKEPIKLDSHQKAALASAIFAFRRFNRMFKKMRDRLEKEGRMKEYPKMRKYLLIRYLANN